MPSFAESLRTDTRPRKPSRSKQVENNQVTMERTTRAIAYGTDVQEPRTVITYHHLGGLPHEVRLPIVRERWGTGGRFPSLHQLTFTILMPLRLSIISLVHVDRIRLNYKEFNHHRRQEGVQPQNSVKIRSISSHMPFLTESVATDT